MDLASGEMKKCHGSGSPTVVLVSGTGGAFDEWTHVLDSAGSAKPDDVAVLPGVARFTRVCAYDRPGTRRFDDTLTTLTTVPQPTTAQDGVADLHALLTSAHEPGPYVLVGASWGGMITFSAQLGARHITQTNSSHGIAVEQPQIAIDAIRDVVDQNRELKLR